MRKPPSLPAGVPPGFPHAPYRMKGTMRLGVFTVADPLTVPHGVTPLLPQRLLVATIRFLEGDLRYDALWLLSLARRGHRLGNHAHQLWVNEPDVLQAAHAVWGVAPLQAAFDWDDDEVRITPEHGGPVHLTWHARTGRSVPLSLPLSSFIWDHHKQLAYSTAFARIKEARPTTLNAAAWPMALPRLSKPATRLALDISRFSITVPLPRPIAAL
ncbi:hypothetical protein [Streptomyces syringium]|uniref:hypothetical protein n=1 Tax=Streptomyces syringium TaxID=76729 RepID=UPI003453B3E3